MRLRIMPPFLIALAVSILSWKTTGVERFCALRGAVLTVTDGNTVAIATREAVADDDLATLDAQVLTRFQSDADEERVEHVETMHLQLRVIRRMISRLSVCVVGGMTQTHLLRKAADTLRLDNAQFLELEDLTRFGGMPEGRVRDQLRRRERIRAILRQPQNAPLHIADEVALLLAVQSGLLGEGRFERIEMTHAGWASGQLQVVRQVLLPVDLSDLPQPGATRLLTLLPTDALINSLSGDKRHAQVCRTALHAFAAENQARMEAITAGIITLRTGTASARDAR